MCCMLQFALQTGKVGCALPWTEILAVEAKPPRANQEGTLKQLQSKNAVRTPCRACAVSVNLELTSALARAPLATLPNFPPSPCKPLHHL